MSGAQANSNGAGGLDERVDEAQRFLKTFRSLNLATVSTEGEPEASYAPFVRREDGAFCVYVSELSRHTANLRDSGRASVLLIADEGRSDELFARVRLTFRCAAVPIERDSAEFDRLLDRFAADFGDVIGMIRPLTDFQLFALVPESGIYVRGFAQAYRFVGPELAAFLHIRDRGHRGPKGSAAASANGARG